MILKTQALLLQLEAQTNANMAQLLEVNTRMYQLQQEKKEERLQDWNVFDKSVQVFKDGMKSQGGIEYDDVPRSDHHRYLEDHDHNEFA